MERAGRSLERLVESLERAVSAPDVQITSPDFFLDCVNGDRHEVDVSLRTRVGSAEVVVIFECRDWSGPQSVGWLEQLATKRNDVRASKAVAVSSSGFSDLAAAKARFHGIELRELKDIDASAVSGWLRVVRLGAVKPGYEVRGVRVGLARRPSAPLPKAFSSTDLGERCIFWHQGGSLKTLGEIIFVGDSSLSIYRGVPEDGTRVQVTVRVDFERPQPIASIVTPCGNLVLASIDVDLTLWQQRSEFQLNRVVSYRRDEEELIEAAEYLLSVDGRDEIWMISRDLSTEKRFVTRRPAVPGSELPEGFLRVREVPLENSEDYVHR